jgi:amino acid transporter
MTVGLAFGIMLFVFAITTFSKRGTKGFTTLGLSVKVIPLLLVVIGGMVFIPLGLAHPIDTAPVVETPYNSSILNILTIMPAILFTYNGFLTSASMMNESKNYKTYKVAFISAMSFAAILYI